MAGSPNVPLSAIQAAVLKSAAGTQGQQPATPDNVSGVRRDMSVMTDQVLGYSASVQQGINQARGSSAALNARQADDASKANAFRQQQIASEQMAKQEIEARKAAQLAAIEQQRQEQQARFEASLQEAAARRAASSASAAKQAYENELAQRQVMANEVARKFKRNMNPIIGELASGILSDTVDYNDAKEYVNNILKYEPQKFTPMGLQPKQVGVSASGHGMFSGAVYTPKSVANDILKFAKDYYDALYE